MDLMEKYDIIIIGGGPGGYLAAERAGQAGKSVLLIEKSKLGGTCLNVGCIPSKTFLNSAKLLTHAKDSDLYGVEVSEAAINHINIVKRKTQVVERLVNGVNSKMKQCNVQVINGTAFVEKRTAEGFVVSVDGREFCGTDLILATGSSPTVPLIKGMEEQLNTGFVMSNERIFDLERLPKRLVVIGGGVIGLELASYFKTAGAHVTIVEMMDHIGGSLEKELSSLLLKQCLEKGILCQLRCKVTEVKKGLVIWEKNGDLEEAEADAVLLAIGRTPTIDGFGLENIGVYTEKGAIVTDDKMRTNISGVYAVGDVNGRYLLAHVAYREAEVAINHILGKKDMMRYNAVPSVIYTDPEIATVGETESSAVKKGYKVKVIKMPMVYSGRYMAEKENGGGLCKLIVDQHTNRVLGIHLIGPYVSEMIFGAALMIETELNIEALKKIIFPHPTVSEIIREALFEI